MWDGQGRAGLLRRMGIMDTPPEPEFDTVVRQAAAVTGAPIALVSLLDDDRQWFKARVGLDVSQTPIASSFCLHAVRGTDLFEVEDAAVDERFTTNPLVTGKPGIRFYAGMPLEAEGQRIGTLCVIDDKPRPGLSDAQRRAMRALASRVDELLAARRARLAAEARPNW